jgi:4-hydroxy-tetrahydrodipicolinate synthase
MAIGMSELRQSLHGVSAVPICPFDKSEVINEADFRKHITFMRNSGVDTLVPCGNTMEFYALDLSEAKRLTEITVEIVDHRIPVIAGVGYDIATAIALAKHGEKAGADAVMVHQPVHPYVSAQGFTDYITAIAESISIGVVLYIRRDVLLVEDYLKLFQLPNVVGVKHATNDLQNLAHLISKTSESDAVWICGTAEGWAPFYFLVGAKGFTSGLANVFPKFTLDMRNALKNNNYQKAMEVWHQILPFEEMRAKENNAFNVSVVKEAMTILGMPGGVVRKPASALALEDKKKLRSLLEQWNFTRAVEARGN